MKRGALLAEQNRCTTCHGAELAAAKQVPRLTSQREVARALAEFRCSARVGYTSAMDETSAGRGTTDLDDLALYIARLSTPSGVGRAASSTPR